MKTSLAQQQCSGRGRRPLGQQDDRIAIAVWELLMFYARRSELGTDALRRFAIASGAYLLVWAVLAFGLGIGDVLVGLAAPLEQLHLKRYNA